MNDIQLLPAFDSEEGSAQRQEENGGTQRPGSPDGSLATETRKPGSLK